MTFQVLIRFGRPGGVARSDTVYHFMKRSSGSTDIVFPSIFAKAVALSQHDKTQDRANLTTVDRIYFGYIGTYSAGSAFAGWRIRVR